MLFIFHLSPRRLSCSALWPWPLPAPRHVFRERCVASFLPVHPCQTVERPTILQMQDSSESVSQLTTAACRHMLSHISVQGISESRLLQDTLCSLLPGGPQQQIGQRTAVIIIDSLDDMLPSWRTASSKRARFSAQAVGAAVGRLLRLVACSCHCAVLTTSSCQMPKTGHMQGFVSAPRFDGTRAGWGPFVSATAAALGGEPAAAAWLSAAAYSANRVQAAASSLPHTRASTANSTVLVLGRPGQRAAGLGSASCSDPQLQAAAVRAPGKAARGAPAWDHAACIVHRTHTASPGNARLASMHVGSGADGARAGAVQLPLAAAALATGDITNALASGGGEAFAQWHAAEWHESLLDMGVAVGAVGKQGFGPPLQPAAHSITQAAAAWSARKSRAEYQPQRVAGRQGKFARVGAPPLCAPAAPGRGFWATRAAALGLLQEPGVPTHNAADRSSSAM